MGCGLLLSQWAGLEGMEPLDCFGKACSHCCHCQYQQRSRRSCGPLFRLCPASRPQSGSNPRRVYRHRVCPEAHLPVRARSARKSMLRDRQRMWCASLNATVGSTVTSRRHGSLSSRRHASVCRHTRSTWKRRCCAMYRRPCRNGSVLCILLLFWSARTAGSSLYSGSTCRQVALRETIPRKILPQQRPRNAEFRVYCAG